MRGIFEEAARVASVMAFAISNAPRGEYRKFADRQWFEPDCGLPVFRDERGRPLVDQMVEMAWFATGRAMAMGHPKPGTGSAYTWTYRDANGDWLDPARTYRLRLPAPVPAKDFWSIVVYDLWTRSMLANGQTFPSRNSYAQGSADERRRVHRHLHRPRSTLWLRGELDSHTARERAGSRSCACTARPSHGSTGTWKPGDLEPVEV